MRHIADIPVPKLHCMFEDDGAAYIVTEYIEGVVMSELSSEQCVIAQQELERYRETLRGLKSCKIRGPTELMVPPYRVGHGRAVKEWKLRDSEDEEFVFCHNDLSQHNVIVDPTTLKIKAIIDWEYAGFYPEYFEGQFWKLPGPSVAIKGETDDTEKLLEFLKSMEV